MALLKFIMDYLNLQKYAQTGSLYDSEFVFSTIIIKAPKEPRGLQVLRGIDLCYKSALELLQTLLN